MKRASDLPDHLTLRLIRDLRTKRRELAAKRNKLDREIQRLEESLTGFGCSNRKTIQYYIEQELRRSGRAMRVRDLAVAVAGCKSKNQRPEKAVGDELPKMPNVVHVSLGLYRLI